MPIQNEMIQGALTEAKLETVNPQLAKGLVNTLLDGGKILDEKAMRDLVSLPGSSKEPAQSTEALITQLGAEAKQHSGAPNTRTFPEQQDTQLIGLLGLVQEHVHTFQNTFPKDNPQLIQLVSSMLDDLKSITSASSWMEKAALVSTVPRMWATETKIRALLGQQAKEPVSPGLLALLKQIQPLISLLACAQFLFPESSKVKFAIGKSATTFVWFHKMARILFAKINFAEQAQLEAASKTSDEKVASNVKTDENEAKNAEFGLGIEESQSAQIPAAAVEAIAQSPEQPVAADTIEQKRERLAAIRQGLAFINVQKIALEIKNKEEIQQLEVQTQALRQMLTSPEGSEATITNEQAAPSSVNKAVAEGLPPLAQEQGFNQFTQEMAALTANLNASPAPSLADLQTKLFGLRATRDGALRQEQAKLEDLETKLVDYGLSDAYSRIAPTKKEIELLTIALAATSAEPSAEVLAQIKALDQTSINQLLDEITQDETERQEFLKFFEEIRNPAQKPIAASSWGSLGWAALTTYVVSEETIHKASGGYISLSTKNKLKASIETRLEELQTWLESTTAEHEDINQKIRETKGNISAIQQKYPEFIQSVVGKLDDIESLQQAAIVLNYTTQTESLSMQETVKAEEIAALEVEVGALEQAAQAEQEARAREAQASAPLTILTAESHEAKAAGPESKDSPASAEIKQQVLTEEKATVKQESPMGATSPETIQAPLEEVSTETEFGQRLARGLRTAANITGISLLITGLKALASMIASWIGLNRNNEPIDLGETQPPRDRVSSSALKAEGAALSITDPEPTTPENPAPSPSDSGPSTNSPGN